MTIVQRTVIDEAKAVVSMIQETHDFNTGFRMISSILGQAKKMDDVIGVLITGMEPVWNPAEHEGERFIDAVVRVTGLSPDTIRRHLDVKKFFDMHSEEIPEAVLPSIQEADQKSLIRIVRAAVVHGFDEDEWGKIGEAVYSGEKSVSQVIRKITKTQPRTNWLGISIDEKGVLTVHANEGGEMVHKEIGRLHVNNPDQTVQKGILRVTRGANIQDHIEH